MLANSVLTSEPLVPHFARYSSAHGSRLLRALRTWMLGSRDHIVGFNVLFPKSRK